MTNLEEIKPKLVEILRKNDVAKAGIFGSYARGEQRRRSDLDVLVQIDKRISLFDFIGIKNDIEDELGMKIDLVEYSCIKPAIREQILAEEIRVI
jgi:predicted nucleotidyltransferase